MITLILFASCFCRLLSPVAAVRQALFVTPTGVAESSQKIKISAPRVDVHVSKKISMTSRLYGFHHFLPKIRNIREGRQGQKNFKTCNSHDLNKSLSLNRKLILKLKITPALSIVYMILLKGSILKFEHSRGTTSNLNIPEEKQILNTLESTKIPHENN